MYYLQIFNFHIIRQIFEKCNLFFDIELSHLKHRDLSGLLHHLRHGLHLLPLLGGELVVVRVPQVAPEIPATIRVGSIGFYLREQHDDVVSLGQGKEASLSYIAVTYPLPRLEKF